MNPAAFLADVLAAPEHLAALAQAYREPGGPLEAVPAARRRSDRADRPRQQPLRRAGRGAAPAASAAWRRSPSARRRRSTSPPPAGSLLVAVSASGATEETVEAAARHPGTVVAVTNKPESPLAETADVVLPLLSGEERGGVACRTFQATLAALGLLGPPRGPARVRPRRRGVRRRGRAGGARLARRLARRGRRLLAAGGPIHAIAPAARISTAEQSALMLREGPRLPAGAAETGDWLHVDVYLTVWPDYRALLFAGAAHDAAVLDWVRRRRGALIAVGERLPEADLQIDLAGRRRAVGARRSSRRTSPSSWRASCGCAASAASRRTSVRGARRRRGSAPRVRAAPGARAGAGPLVAPGADARGVGLVVRVEAEADVRAAERQRLGAHDARGTHSGCSPVSQSPFVHETLTTSPGYGARPGQLARQPVAETSRHTRSSRRPDGMERLVTISTRSGARSVGTAPRSASRPASTASGA